MSIGDNQGLRYLEAARVEGPHRDLEGFEVSTPSGERLGKLDGFIVDPARRRLCSFVVRRSGLFRTRRYLVPLCPAQLDAEHQVLRVDPDPPERREFDPAAFERFSDDDVLTALFGSSAAA
jgi:uncharacterized protein YrrD